MRYLLDSNIIIAASLALHAPLRARLAACDEGDVATSAIVYAEIMPGFIYGKPPPVEVVRALVEEIPVLPFDLAAAVAYADLPFRRGSFDQFIAAHALSLGLTLVTDNIADFESAPSLSVVNWMRVQ